MFVAEFIYSKVLRLTGLKSQQFLWHIFLIPHSLNIQNMETIFQQKIFQPLFSFLNIYLIDLCWLLRSNMSVWWRRFIFYVNWEPILLYRVQKYIIDNRLFDWVLVWIYDLLQQLINDLHILIFGVNLTQYFSNYWLINRLNVFLCDHIKKFHVFSKVLFSQLNQLILQLALLIFINYFIFLLLWYYLFLFYQVSIFKDLALLLKKYYSRIK